MQQFNRFTMFDSTIMLVDHQRMTIDWVKSLPKVTTIASCRVLARMAVEYAMPLVLTTTMEDYVGSTIPEISDIAPESFESRYKRGGELSCWDASDLRDGVKALARPNIILAGLTTDICLFWAAVDAQKLGYKVMVVADACGTMSALGDTLTYDRLRGLGITVTVINQVVTELVSRSSVHLKVKKRKRSWPRKLSPSYRIDRLLKASLFDGVRIHHGRARRQRNHFAGHERCHVGFHDRDERGIWPGISSRRYL